MKVLIQRCLRGNVSINKKIISEIKRGFVVLAGFCIEDTQTDLDYIAQKILSIRIFEDKEGKINLSLNEINGELLIIPQFTLYADTIKGNRPSFMRAAPPQIALNLFDLFYNKINELNQAKYRNIKKIVKGKFGENMQIELINDGPFTILIDSKEKLGK